MLKNFYKPSKKGLKYGIHPCTRIFFLDEHYVYFYLLEDGTYTFRDPNSPTKFRFADAVEWHPRLKKPDSLWVIAGLVSDVGSIAEADHLYFDGNTAKYRVSLSKALPETTF